MSDSPDSVRPAANRRDRALNILATGLGLGYFPRAPGTVGSLLGPPLIWGLGLGGAHPMLTALWGGVFFLAGVPICNAGSRVLNAKDPGQVVFDEIAAFFWVFLFAPLTLPTAALGFFLFRAFDIVKPWPIRRIERLPRGWGIMADDALAGLMAGGILAVVWRAIG